MDIRISHEYSGHSDYWGGNGRRHDNGAGCLFAFYSSDTTLRDCVDQWVDDFYNGGYLCDFENDNGAFDDVTADDIRNAIVDSLTKDGHRDYDNGALCQYAKDCEDGRVCVECAARIGEQHDDICEYRDDADTDGDCPVCPDDCEDDCSEPPYWIILVEIDVCSDCGAKHYPGDF